MKRANLIAQPTSMLSMQNDSNFINLRSRGGGRGTAPLFGGLCRTAHGGSQSSYGMGRSKFFYDHPWCTLQKYFNLPLFNICAAIERFHVTSPLLCWYTREIKKNFKYILLKGTTTWPPNSL